MELIEITGYAATTFTVVAFIPQIWKVWRTRETKDISLATFLILVCGAILWTAYGFLIESLPIIITNVIIGTFQSVIVSFKLKYG